MFFSILTNFNPTAPIMVDQAKLDGKVRYLDLQGVGKNGTKNGLKVVPFCQTYFFPVLFFQPFCTTVYNHG